MGFFAELVACKAQSFAVPFWLFGTGLRWILWVMISGLVPGIWRLAWFLLVGLIEWASWRSTLSCLRDRLMPYQQSIILGIAPALAARILVSPYLLDPIRGYMPINYPYQPPSMVLEMIVRLGFLMFIWRVGYGALLRARTYRACGAKIVPDVSARAWSITSAMLFMYVFLLLSPVMYSILHLIRPAPDFIPFCKDIFVGAVLGGASLVFFTLYADALTSETCRK